METFMSRVSWQPTLDIDQLVFQLLLAMVLHPLTNIPNFSSIRRECLHHPDKPITRGLARHLPPPDFPIHHAYISLENTGNVLRTRFA